MQTATKQLWASVLAAIVGSLCCVAIASLPLFGMLLAAGVAFASPPHTVTLAVENMTCGTCPIVVKKALERVPGVGSTSVDFDKKTATVTFDPDRATSAKLTQATTDAGFPSKLIVKP